jgi:hypothetical protein
MNTDYSVLWLYFKLTAGGISTLRRRLFFDQKESSKKIK